MPRSKFIIVGMRVWAGLSTYKRPASSWQNHLALVDISDHLAKQRIKELTDEAIELLEDSLDGGETTYE